MIVSFSRCQSWCIRSGMKYLPILSLAVFAAAAKDKRNAFPYPGIYPAIYTVSFPYHISPIPPLTAVAELRSYGDVEGSDGVKGRIMFMQTVGGAVLMSGNVTGLSPGAHGLHIHEFGDTMQGCKSMGPHYNPGLVNHGGPADPYRHVGDLGNIMAGEDGVAKIQESDHLISLDGPHSILGRGLVVHMNKDDFGRGGDKESLRTGNAGGRVACAVISWSLPPPPFHPQMPQQPNMMETNKQDP